MSQKVSEIHKEKGTRTYVDAHVHIHDCFDLQQFLDAAARNFAFHTAKTVSKTLHRYVLCLTESYGTDKFGELARRADSEPANAIMSEESWSIRHGSDDKCLIVAHPDLGEILVVAGRQIVTAERLEILALGSVQKWEDGQAVSDVVQSVIDSDAIPVLPWGFGKWLGRRSGIVANLIKKFDDGSLYLGDNSGRPGMMPAPAEFTVVGGSAIRILPGSDPLPFKSEYDRAGSFGFYIDDLSQHEGVWNGLRKKLQQGDGSIHCYGSLESPLRFVRNQVAMQYVTRVSNRRSAS
jgi:hypothetical protein